MKKGKSKRRIIIGLIVGIVLLLISGTFLAPIFLKDLALSQYSEAKPSIGTIEKDQRFSGVIQSKDRQDIVANKNLQIYELFVSEGQEVEKEQDLFETYAGEIVTATVNGEISKIDVEEEDEVPAGGKIMNVIDFKNLQVAIKVDEYQLSSINKSTPVTVEIDSIKQKIAGIVGDISKEAKNENGISYFTAVIDFQGNSDIRIGMNAEVVIVKEKAEGILTIPMTALQFNEKNEPFVFVKDDSGQPTQKGVTLGINDGIQVQILEGVTETDTLLIENQVTTPTTFTRPPGAERQGNN
ncbi:MAG: HlyD family efflux transporter periplasmic adaptor subunit [Eubacteriaceae bacterium]